MKSILFYTILTTAIVNVQCLYASEWSAVVSQTPGKGRYDSIQKALHDAPSTGTPWKIYIEDGTWEERLVIDKPVVLVGQSKNYTIIEANTPAGKKDNAGNKLGTSKTSTVEVKSNNVTIENLTIKNSFDYPANAVLAKDDPLKINDTQAVALMVSDNADKVRFRRIKLEGFQDTFYSKNGSRSYFTDCTISGTIDFIFGGGVAVFDRCDIIARVRTDISPPLGYITAPSTPKTSKYGLIFLNSRLIKEDGVPSKSYAFGRPWHPTSSFPDGRYADPNAIGLTAFLNCDIDDHIYGWDKMSGKDKMGDKVWFYPNDSRFYEYNNRGPGSYVSTESYKLPVAESSQFTIANIFLGWGADMLQ